MEEGSGAFSITSSDARPILIEDTQALQDNALHTVGQGCGLPNKLKGGTLHTVCI